MRIIDDLLREAKDAAASDVHISPERLPFFRIDGKLQPVGDQPLTEEEVAQMVATMLGQHPHIQDVVATERQGDFSYALGDGTRFRVNVFYRLNKLAAALRLVPEAVHTIDELHLPPQAMQF